MTARKLFSCKWLYLIDYWSRNILIRGTVSLWQVLTLLVVATPTAILSSALRYVLSRHCDPVGMEKPRNVSTAIALERAYKPEHGRIRRMRLLAFIMGKSWLLLPLDFLLSACWLHCLWSPLRDLFYREGKRIGVTALPRFAQRRGSPDD